MSDNNYKPVQVTTFQQNMYAWLGVLEGNSPTPYLDTTGNPTVSVGVNLTVRQYRDLYLNDIVANGDITSGTQQSDLDNLLANNYSSDTAFQNAVTHYDTTYHVSGLPALTSQQAQDLFNLAYSTQYKILFNASKPLGIANNPVDNIDVSTLESSTEGLALLSLSYNIKGNNPGNNLLWDLNKEWFNRPDAWFQVRYESNGGSSASGGIAKRRYEESEVFGLYAPEDITGSDTIASINEALDIYAELSNPSTQLDTSNSIAKGATFRDYAFNYESRILQMPMAT